MTTQTTPDARQLFCRIIRDTNDRMPRYQVIGLVAKTLGLSPLAVGLEVGISNIEGWKP